LQKLLIRVMTARTAAEKGDLTPLDHVLRGAVREGVLSQATAPLVVQRVGQKQAWQLSLAIVRTPTFEKLRCNDHMWLVVERCCPCADSAAACRPWLCHVFSKSNLHVVSQNQSKPPH
jgi:hypothetical protein